MNSKDSGDFDRAFCYSLVWGWLHIANHRYGTVPSGQMQVTLTMILLNELGYHPTVTELSEITNLAKSNVSRYVSAEMKAGFLEEYIDPNDRRRRKLRPTGKAAPELAAQQQRIKRIFEVVRSQREISRTAGSSIDFQQLKNNLHAISHAAVDED